MELETYSIERMNFEDLELAIDTTKRNRMYIVLGETLYSELEAFDKTGLTTSQSYIYWAEIYYSIAEYYLFLARRDKFARRAARESRTQGDVTYSTYGATGKELSAYDYLAKGNFCMSEAGYGDYIRNRLTRRTSIHGN